RAPCRCVGPRPPARPRRRGRAGSSGRGTCPRAPASRAPHRRAARARGARWRCSGPSPREQTGRARSHIARRGAGRGQGRGAGSRAAPGSRSAPADAPRDLLVPAASAGTSGRRPRRPRRRRPGSGSRGARACADSRATRGAPQNPGVRRRALWLVTGGAVIAACGSGAAHRGRTVVYASGADLQSVNPLLTMHPLAKQVERYVLLTTLVRYDSALVPRPYLARVWTWSEDRKSLTFRLQPGVRWSDGVPTTARDVAWTLSAARDAATGYPRLNDFADVAFVNDP